MLIQEIEHLMRNAPPGTRFEIEVVRITVPEATEAEPKAGETPVADWTPEAVIEWVRRTHGPEGLKLREWAALPIGVSMRELERASRDGRLKCREKGYGKDHRGLVTGPDEMLAFLGGGADTQLEAA